MPGCLIPIEPARRPLIHAISSTVRRRMLLSTTIWMSTPIGNHRRLGSDSRERLPHIRIWRTERALWLTHRQPMPQSCNKSSNLKRPAALGVFNAFQDFAAITVLHHFAQAEKQLAIDLVVIGCRHAITSGFNPLP